MNRYFPDESREAAAYRYVSENLIHDPRIDLQKLALCAAYAAIQRYVTRGDELYVVPTTPTELETLLKSYALDAIHSQMSQSRARIPSGGYSTARNIANESLTNVLAASDNCADLLSLHRNKTSWRRSNSNSPTSVHHNL
jgi:hypothetical protein